jgi:hypothetical protein
MTRQLPTVLEMADRITPDLRREFFDATVAAVRRHRPAGYATRGTAAMKVRLLERGDYRLYRAARSAIEVRRRLLGRRSEDERRL